MNTKQIGEQKKLLWYHVYKKKRIYLLSLLPLSFSILLLVRNNANIAEYVFSQGIYKWLSQIISNITGIFPFSLMEFSLIVFILCSLIYIIRYVITIISTIKNNKKILGYRIVEGILDIGCTISIILFMFVMLGGTNYYRYSFAEHSGLEVRESSVEELYELSNHLAQRASRIRNDLALLGAEDENGVLLVNTSGWKDIGQLLDEAMDNASVKYPVLGGNYGIPKSVLFSRFMSRMEITGIYWPFTIEANINTDTTQFTIPVTMGHEMAHQRGFMREDEANFIGYLICKESPNLIIQYSGIMLALSYSSTQLYKHDENLYYAVLDKYSQGMVQDVREDYYYWKQFEDTVISAVSSSMNDNYLKMNNQKDGVKSYGRMVDLLLAEYRAYKNE